VTRIVKRGSGWLCLTYGLVAGVTALLIIGIPTGVVPNGWFVRMTPTRPQDYGILGITVILASFIGATYALPATCPLRQGHLSVGGVFAFLAIGCPVCNKIVVVLLGVGGALTYFEPIQPFLGMLSVVMLTMTLALRLRTVGLAPVTWRTC